MTPERERNELLASVLQGADLATVIPATLAIVEGDPTATAGRFRGDLLRALMRVRGRYWTAHPGEYDRYRAALRRAALLRRHAAAAPDLEFWTPLDDEAGDAPAN